VSLHCTWADLLRDAASRLRAAGVDHPQREARLILAHVLGVSSSDAILREGDEVDGRRLADFEGAVDRRAAHEPLSRIRGWREFYGRRFQVSPAVLDPRPDTELLVEAALERLPPDGRVLDLGTGSGCILLTLLAERPGAAGAGVDLSPGALDVARANALDLGLWDRALLIDGGWEAARPLGRFDVVVSNPPYIPSADIPGLDPDVREHDPMLALDGGPDGLAPYRDICALAGDLLTPGGWLLMEVGAGQADDVLALAAASGLAAIGALEDLNGIRRVVVVRSSAGTGP